MIRSINISLLENHPDNPRKDVGDVTELAESIKESGILQNLTVVKHKDRYRVIIGHRRLAAAKLAGLSVVPCAVVEMDDKTQVATMLAENMQRADLTVFEQAQGIQMMFDLGSTADEISEKTGFSKKTIGHRVKLLELDEEKFKDSLERGATLSDFIKLEKLKDPELKNEVLKHVATNDFDWQLKRALDKQNKDENIAKWMEILNSFAKQVKTQKGYENVGTLTYLGSDPSKFKIPEDASETDYYFYLIEHNPVYFYLMKKKTAEKESEDAVLNRQQVEKEQRRNELREAFERAYELRKDFVYEYTGSKDDIPVLTKCLMEPLRETTYGMVSSTKFADLLKIKLGEGESVWDTAKYNEICSSRPQKILLAAIICFSDNVNHTFYDHNNEYKDHPKLRRLYEVLLFLGYQISTEEQQLIDGTHELYVKKKESE